MARPKRKYILFLVEGYTDINALSAGIVDLYEKYSDQEEYEIKFCTLDEGDEDGGDITSKYGIEQGNIEKMISKLYVDPFLEQNSYVYPKEIFEIIQIIDLDGAFVEDKNIFPLTEENFKGRVFYGADGIFAKNPDYIRERNQRKRENIRQLVSLNEIVIRPKNHRNTKTIKYSVYYFSCNMDHYIHGEANLTPQDKVIKSDDFLLECYDNCERFCDRLCHGQGVVEGLDYTESWRFIMTPGLRSIEPHTNVNLLIDKIKGMRQV